MNHLPQPRRDTERVVGLQKDREFGGSNRSARSTFRESHDLTQEALAAAHEEVAVVAARHGHELTTRYRPGNLATHPRRNDIVRITMHDQSRHPDIVRLSKRVETVRHEKARG